MPDDFEILGNINDTAVAERPLAPPAYQFAPPSPPPANDDYEVLGREPAAPVVKPPTFTQKIGRAITYPGKLLAAETQDVVENIANKVAGWKSPESAWRNVMALDSGEQQTPYEKETADVKGFSGLYKDVSNGIIKTLPQMYVGGLAGRGLMALKMNPLAANAASMGATFGFTENGFSPKEAALMAAFPVVGHYGGQIAETVLGKMGIQPESELAKQAVRWVGSLAASQTYMDVTKLPEYLNPNIDPAQKRKAFIDGLAQNIGFHLLSVPGMAEAGITQDKINAAAKDAAQQYQDDFWRGVQSKSATPITPFQTPFPKPNRLRVKFTPPKPEEVQNAPIGTQQQQVSPETELPRTEARPDVQPDTSQVRQEESPGPDGGHRPVGTTPVEEPKPDAGQALTSAVPTLKPGDTAPVEFDSMFGPMPMFKVTQPFAIPGLAGPPQAVGSKVTKAVLDKAGIKVPEPEQAKVPTVPETPPVVPPKTEPTPAIKVGDQVFPAQPGENHQAIYNRVKAQQPDMTGMQEGFVDDKGQFVSRQVAAQETGLPTKMEPGKLHTEDLGVPVPKEATGIEAIKKLVSDPENGLQPNVRRTWMAVLNHPVFQDSFWDDVTVRFNPDEKRASGWSYATNKLIELSSLATADTLPHELFHFLYDRLPKEERDALEAARVEEVKKIPNAPSGLLDGKMTSDQFLESGLPRNLYHLINAGEFLSEFAGAKFAADSFEGRHNKPASWWQELHTKVKAMVKAVVNAIRRNNKVQPARESAYENLLSGKYKSTPETGIQFEDRQAALPRSLREYEKQRAFQEPATAERTMAAYGDLVEMKNKAADAIEASPKARKMVMLDNQEILTQLSSTDMAQQRLTFGNYDAMRARTEGSDMGLRSGVIVDAFRGLGYEQHRAMALRKKLAEQEAVINKESFVNKVQRLMDRRLGADTAKQIRETYHNQIVQEAGDVMRELQAKGKTEAQYDQLRNILARLQKLPDYNEAVAQRVQDIVDVVSATEGGLNLLFQGGDRTGTQIARAYLDIKQSIADATAPPVGMGQWLSKFDRENYLSEAEKQRLESRLPVISEDAKAFTHLAAQVLAANTGLRQQLMTLEYFRQHPEFQAEVTAVGEKFRKQFEKDPNNAIQQIVKTATSLTKKQMTAEAAWLRLNKEILPEIQRYNDLRQAVAIDDAVQASPEWKQLVNRIHQDAGAVRIPDSELEQISSGNVWNEFTGRQQFRSPTGAVYDIDLGYTRAGATEAQGRMQAYLGDVSTWLGDPKNQDSPDRAYWNMRYDFVDAAMNVSTTLSPTASYAVFGVKSPWGMIEFLFKGTMLPAAKLSFTASNNFQRAWAVADQWFQGVAPEWRTLLLKAAASHGYDPKFDSKQYREEILDRLASEYRHGRALQPGDRLNNGIVLTQQDLAAFKYQGKAINQLFSTVKNVGREKVMTEGLLLDEWAKNVFGLRAPQELGAAPGTTLPHEFSTRGKALASRVSEITPGNTPELVKLFDQENVFKSFVQRFIAERRADYSAVTPFEDAYRQLAEKWKLNEPDAPNNIAGIVDYIEANTGAKHDRAEIEAILVGEMEGQLRKFYRDFVAKEEPSDVRALRAEKQSSFTTGFQRDVGSSFFYDYGAVTTPEIRSLGIDSTNFHLVRFVRSLDATLIEYDRALAEYSQLTGEKQRLEFIKQRRPDFKSGQDYRDFERLQDDRNNIKFLRDNISTAYGGHQIRNIELFSKAGRLSGDFISSALTGLLTSAKIFVGSTVKMGMVLGRINRFYMGAYLRGAVATVMSATGMLGRTAVRVPGQTLKAWREGWNDSLSTALARGIETSIEGFFQQGKYFNQQYQYGLGFKSPAGFRAYNILTDPYSHGGGYDPKLSRLSLIRMPQKALWRVLSTVEAPLEVLKAMFPQMAYAVAYDAAARTAGWTIDGIAAQARRSFEFLEKTGGLAQYDLNQPSSLKNILPADYVLPGFLIKKGQTELFQARDWWQRAIDIPLNETVINYWRKLSQTPKEQRSSISFLASEFDDPAQAKLMEERRAGGLMSVLLKDVHHAAVENRPIQFRMDTTWRFMFPLLGWTSHSVRSTLQALGRSPTDPRSRAVLWVMSASTLLGFIASTILLGEGEKDLKKAVTEIAYGEEYPEKTLAEAHSGKELAKLTALDAVSWIPQVHNIAASLLGESSQQVSETGISIFTVQKMETLLRYVKGVIATGDMNYGLPGLVKQLVPFGRYFVNKLASQQGLIELKNVRTIVQKFGPEDLLNKKGPTEFKEPTELTPYKNKLANAVFTGDPAQVQAAGQEFIQKAMGMGQSQEQAANLLRQVMSGINPLMIGGRKMTDAQRQDFMSQLGQRETDRVNQAEANWQQAQSMFGLNTPLTKQERGSSGGAVPLRRSGLTRNRLRLGRGSTRTTSRFRGMRTPRLSLSRQRFRGTRNRLRRRSKII